MKNLFIFTVMMWFLPLMTVSSATAAEDHYVVQKSDYRGLADIGKKLGVPWRSIAKANGLKKPYVIRVGQRLRIPTVTVKPTAPMKAIPPRKAKVRYAQWKNVGADPLVKGGISDIWIREGDLKLSGRQAQRLSRMGLSQSDISKVRADLSEGNCRAITRPEGYTWRGMAMGKHNWGNTINATGDFVPVWTCPTVGNKQIDIAMRCGNVAWNVPAPLPPPPVKEEALACEANGAVWAQIGGHGYGASTRFNCLFLVGDHWKIGPAVGASGSHFNFGDWIEDGYFFGAGVEARGAYGDNGPDAIEVVMLIGQASSGGHSTDDMVKKLKADGIDARISVQIRERFQLSEDTGVIVRFMPWADFPLTNFNTDILYDGNKVASENGRHIIVGSILRFEYDKVGWKLKPELTLGLWHISDINEVGGKILLGVSTKDDVWRIGAGVQFPDPHFIIEVECNAGLGWLRLNSEEAIEALTVDATSSEEYLMGDTLLPPLKNRIGEVANDGHGASDNYYGGFGVNNPDLTSRVVSSTTPPKKHLASMMTIAKDPKPAKIMHSKPSKKVSRASDNIYGGFGFGNPDLY